MPKVSWMMSYDSAANFIRFPQCKNFENRLRFDKITESLKVGRFFEIQCIYTVTFKILRMSTRPMPGSSLGGWTACFRRLSVKMISADLARFNRKLFSCDHFSILAILSCLVVIQPELCSLFQPITSLYCQCIEDMRYRPTARAVCGAENAGVENYGRTSDEVRKEKLHTRKACSPQISAVTIPKFTKFFNK